MSLSYLLGVKLKFTLPLVNGKRHGRGVSRNPVEHCRQPGLERLRGEFGMCGQNMVFAMNARLSVFPVFMQSSPIKAMLYHN